MYRRMRMLRGLVCISMAIGMLIILLIKVWGILLAVVLLAIGFWQLLYW